MKAGEGENDDVMSFNALGRHNEATFAGLLDDLRIYDRALSAAEVQTTMAGGQ